MSNSFCHPNEIVSQYIRNMLITPSLAIKASKTHNESKNNILNAEV